MTASQPVLDDQEENIKEAEPEDKLTLNNLVDGFQLFKTAFDFLYDMGPSMMRMLKLQQTVEEALIPYRNIFLMTNQTEIMMYFCQV